MAIDFSNMDAPTVPLRLAPRELRTWLEKKRDDPAFKNDVVGRQELAYDCPMSRFLSHKYGIGSVAVDRRWCRIGSRYFWLPEWARRFTRIVDERKLKVYFSLHTPNVGYVTARVALQCLDEAVAA